MSSITGSILLVDDEEKILKALSKALRDAGHEVVATSRPSEAQRLLSERPPEAHQALFGAVAEDPAATVTVDLARQTLTLPDGRSVQFHIDEFSKHCLLEGVDELGYILQQENAIAAYETKRPLTINALA